MLNQNFTNLIEYCKQKINSNDANLQKYINTYNKINSEINNNKLENNNNDKNKNTAKKDKTSSSNTKKYLPYNYKNDENASQINSILNNTNSFIDSNVVLLTADEKIKELKGIIQEKENEINILKLVSCESEGGKVQLVQIQKSFQNGFELHSKIRELEDKRQDLENENEKLNDKLMEYQNNIFKIQNILDDIKLNNLNNENIVPSKNDSLEKIVYNLDMNQAINDMCKIINKLILNNNNNFFNENDIKDSKDKFEFSKKIQQILNYNDKNVKNISNEYLNSNNDFKNKKNNIGTNSNTLSYKQLAKKQYKKEGEQKFFNKFVNIDK